MNPPTDQQKHARSARVPHSFFYDRVVPALFVILALALLVVVVLVFGALAGAIPVK